MTEQPDDAARRLARSGAAQAEPEFPPYWQATVRRLTLKSDAMQLALLAADEAVRKAVLFQDPPAQLLRDWRAANLLAETAFNSLRFEVLNTIDAMRITRPPR